MEVDDRSRKLFDAKKRLVERLFGLVEYGLSVFQTALGTVSTTLLGGCRRLVGVAVPLRTEKL